MIFPRTLTLKTILSRLSIFSLLLLLCTSCATNYDISTNLDQDNIKQYFSASKVRIYNSEQEFTGKYKYIGIVEGQDCQAKPHHAIPDKINARTNARQHAFNLQANAVIFTSCAKLNSRQLKQNDSDTKQCYALIICYAKAYSIDNSETTKAK